MHVRSTLGDGLVVNRGRRRDVVVRVRIRAREIEHAPGGDWMVARSFAPDEILKADRCVPVHSTSGRVRPSLQVRVLATVRSSRKEGGIEA